MSNIIALIAAACMFSNPSVTHQQKLTCMDYMVNCSVGPNGEITKKTVEACEKTLQKGDKK